LGYGYLLPSPSWSGTAGVSPDDGNTERRHIVERKQELTRQLASFKETASSMVGLKQLRSQLQKKMASNEFADRRHILEALGIKVNVTTDGRLEIDFTVPKEISQEAIALNTPLNACPRYSIVKVLFVLSASL